MESTKSSKMRWAESVRKRKTKTPCATCFLQPALCLCDLIPKLDLKTRVTLIIHAKELKRTTNTGRLALAALTNSEMFVRGNKDEPLESDKILRDDYQPVLFYPSEDAIELTSEIASKFAKPIQLLVPDGNWRQAGKIHYRQKEWSHLPRVKIGKINEATLHLRHEHMPEGMATLEAIAHAMIYFENAEAGAALMKLYEEKLRRTLIGRGVKTERLISSETE